MHGAFIVLLHKLHYGNTEYIYSYTLIFSRMYDKACYERRKNGIIKKLTSEEFVAYSTIKEKW
mgnify:CR=1 FL=1